MTPTNERPETGRAKNGNACNRKDQGVCAHLVGKYVIDGDIRLYPTPRVFRN